MIAWRLLPNLGWILGVVVLLSVWSLERFHASFRLPGEDPQSRSANPSTRRAVLLGALLIGLSQFVLAQELWQRFVWIFVCIVCVYRFFLHD